MTREVKVVTCCPEKRFCPRDGKNQNKSPVHLFDLKFFDRVLYIIVFRASVLSFLILGAEVPQKNYLLPAGLFFTDSVMFCLFFVLQTLSLLFLCKNFLEIFRTSSSSRISLFPVEKIILLWVLTSLIRL